MGDLDIDVTDLERAFIDDAVEKFNRSIHMATAQATRDIKLPKKRNIEDLGIFRIQKVSNGYFIQVGIQEGYHTEDAYVCTDAAEIGELITAHIVGQKLGD